MEKSILTNIKTILNLDENYTPFDSDIIIEINSAFSHLNQLGVGPPEGFEIEDKQNTWDELGLPLNQLSMVKTYIYLKVRKVFDPPATSFHLEAVNKQIEEHEWRLGVFRDEAQEETV